MTIFARFFHPRSMSTLRHTARGLILAVCPAALSLALAAPAGALVTTNEQGVPVGVQPRVEGVLFDGPIAVNQFGEEGEELAKPEILELKTPNEFSNKNGNPVLHGSAVYAIYWDPTYHYHNDWKEKIDEFFEAVGGASNQLTDVLAVDTQYTDKSNQPAYNRVTFRGAAEDTEAYPVSGCTDPHPLEEKPVLHTYPLGCLTDKQMREQLQHYISVHALPTGMNTVYYLLTPPGLTVCLDKGGETGHCSDFEETQESYEHSFCSYHSDINPGLLPTGDGNTVVYSVIPWTAGGLDDGDLQLKDQTQADYCQDGGFNPEPGKGYEAEPIQQEPNQPEQCPSVIGDGFCDTGLADLIINQVGVEQQNTVTNPLLNAWQDPIGNEATDECRNFFGPTEGSYQPNPATDAGTLYDQEIGGRHYYINDAFDLSALRLTYPGVPCLRGINLQPKFTAPNPVNVNDIVSFDGMESNITLNSAFGYEASGAPDANYATYKWNFGDGSTEISGFAPGAPVCSEPWLSPCAASVFHSYAYGGTYNVTLTATDVGGNVQSTTKAITVIGPPKPTTPETTGGTGSTGSTGSTGATGATPGTQGGPPVSSGAEGVAAPVATAVILSHSLKSVLGKPGLVVRYDVNEQVAGHFEITIPTSLARKLKIKGPAATGFAQGTVPQTLIAKAILVTTKGGSGTVHIQISKTMAAHLRKLHKLSLVLRLSVRNAASHLPVATTVLAAATLSH
ncbi:MAG: PKD domain-containing protein [Solirubrobacteraceae bacterium]